MNETIDRLNILKEKTREHKGIALETPKNETQRKKENQT